MEHWKQPDKGRHQQQQHQYQQNQQEQEQQQHNLNHSQKSQTKVSASTSDHSAIIQQTNPIQSIANVLNQHHHHSKLIQHQKKSQQLEEQATVVVTKNKLDQQQLRNSSGGGGAAASVGVANTSSNINASSQESNLSSAFSHSSNQIDQGNSYLYAYNDFVTSTARAALSSDVKLACRHSRDLNSNQGKEIDNGVTTENHKGILCGHIPVLQRSSLNFENNQESLIDSDEDDALSYILHQHRPQQETRQLAELANDTTNQPPSFLITNSSHPDHSYFPYEGEGNSNFEAQRIDHHLSCSRSSHPRHICGIGGSHNDNLNSIAARLREESQRAFALNQRSRRIYQDNSHQHQHQSNHHQLHRHHQQQQLTSNDIAAIQSHQFTHDLTIIQDQLANASTNGNNQHNSQDRIFQNTSYNNLNNELHLTQVPVDRKTLLLDDSKVLAEGRIITNNSSSSSLNDHSQSTSLTRGHLNHSKRRNSSPGFLSWLFCCLCHLLSPSSRAIQHQHQHSRANLVHATTNVKKRRHKTLPTNEHTTGALGMYTATQQMGQLGGQAGAYYTTQTPQTDTLHQAYTNHAHHPHHYPLSSDSSMGSSVFASSALRMNAFFRSCCSKKCLFVSCLMLILLIFIFVIGLSAYLNFLINLNKPNLTPLSGRLKVESQGDTFTDQLSNRTSKEFLAKQQQYETILRGALDRTQNLLKSYPNHLVKCEVYSFKQGSLWIYFRLFINKRTLMQDTQLMKRKSHDEHLETQFLPRITQQTLHSGFEQLMINFNNNNKDTNSPTNGAAERRSRSSQTAVVSDALRQTRTILAESNKPSSQRDHVKSFDDQISRLMPIIESIDLQSITVTPEYDMLQTNPTIPQPSMNDKLRAPEFISSPSAGVMVATGPRGSISNKNTIPDYEVGSTTTTESSPNTSSLPTVAPRPTTLQPNVETDITQTGSSGEINVSTKKFFLYPDYKENTTRPTPSSKPNVSQNRAPEQQEESPFLTNLRNRKPTTSRTNGLNIIPSPSRNESSQIRNNNSTLKEIASPSLGAESSNKKENVVKLVTVQPATIRNNNPERNNTTSRNLDERQQATSKNSSPLVNSNRNSEFASNFSTSTIVPEPTILSSSANRKDKGVNETVISQMVAPYQKINFSVQPQRDVVVNITQLQPKETSIQDLWNSALGNKKNSSSKVDKQQDNGQPRRLITVTTLDANQNLANNSKLDWHKISELSSEISNTIRASINTSMPSTTTTTTTTTLPTTSSILTFTVPASSTTLKPKVSPHLKQGGSLISTPVRQQHQQHSQQDTFSAVVLNKDFVLVNSEGHVVDPTRNNSAQQMSTRLEQQNRSIDKALRKPQQSVGGGGQRNVTLLNVTINDPHKHRVPKPTGKPPKVKKVNLESSQYISAKNESNIPSTATTTTTTTTSATTPLVSTTTNGALINSKGIRIVDHFLASLDSSRTAAELLSQNLNSTNVNLRPTKNKTQEAFNYNSDLILPTLPTTIELTRSTTSQPPARTTSFHPLYDGWAVGYKTTPGTVDHFTTTSSINQRYSTLPTQITTEGPIKFAAPSNGTLNRPKNIYVSGNTAAHASNVMAAFGSPNNLKPQSSTPMSSFSSQWKPITPNTNNSSAIIIDESWIKNRTSTKRPNISLIVNNDRLTPLVNVPSNQGSQSPFAMSTLILESQSRANSDRRPTNKIVGNNFQVSGPGNEFESHRMSRMRFGDSRSQSASSTFNSFSSTQPNFLASTSTNPPVESNTRVVDDFMITTDRVDSDKRASTALPPSLQINSQSREPLARLGAVNPLDLQPKRTRGPFAFETLKSVSTPSAASSKTGNFESMGAAASAGDLGEINLQQRSERSSNAQGPVDQKLLVRKKLFLGNEDDDEFKSIQTSTSSPDNVDINKVPATEEQTANSTAFSTTTDSRELDQFGDRYHRPALNLTFRRQQPPNFNQQLVTASSQSSNYNTFKCQYYGCKAKGSLKFVCLNYTQICDDFIDCQDESDELDCVSLLKHDSKSNRLSFSNGGGIIYLNRKGSLAPMCIDYFTDSDNRLSGITNTVHDSNAIQMEMIKKQQELIRQINTIGQYACSLQSFSRLVSVKINHHDLVDSLNLIKTSKLYHRLSINGDLDKHSSDSQFGSYRSANLEHEVEVSTSTDCPSQRTVFVKCGSFECGQDSFSVIDRNSTSKKKDGVIINDFPWLVKLYWWGSLSCHGYLIDELWLISSSECFVNKTQTSTADDGNGWTAEISYEHYGNDDYQSIESNRRNIKDILVQPSKINSGQSLGPSIVLAKLEKPVRFSPLNRPICLPLSAMNKTTFELDKMYKDCVTATLPLSGPVSPTQDLLLSKVKVQKSTTDCLAEELKGTLSDDLICVAETTRNDASLRVKDDEATRVLICSSSQANRSRSKWTVVGVQNKAQGLQLHSNKLLFTTVSSQIDWIVDTMNPKFYPNFNLDGFNSSGGNELNPLSTSASQNQTCNRFKCSSGECLSWSRICDGLYDCSSHEDEKDCHK